MTFKRTPPAAKRPTRSADTEEISPEVANLIERLKRWRHKTSAALGIPAYRVLTNATIDRIAESCPTTTEQLEGVSGIGPATIEQFGYDIIELIRETIGAADEEADQTVPEPERAIQDTTVGSARSTPAGTESRAGCSRTHAANGCCIGVASDEQCCRSSDAYWTWRLFRDGYSASQVAAIRRCERVVVGGRFGSRSVGRAFGRSELDYRVRRCETNPGCPRRGSDRRLVTFAISHYNCLHPQIRGIQC